PNAVARVARSQLRLPRCFTQFEPPLDSVYLIKSAPEADEFRVELVEPRADDLGRIAVGIGGDEYDFHLPLDLGIEGVECRGDVREVDRTDVRAMGIAEEEQRDLALGLLAEIELRSVGRGEREVGLGNRLAKRRSRESRRIEGLRLLVASQESEKQGGRTEGCCGSHSLGAGRATRTAVAPSRRAARVSSTTADPRKTEAPCAESSRGVRDFQ